MFNKTKEKESYKSEPVSKTLSIISSSTTVVGKMQVENDLRVDGNVNGDIVSSGKVVIGPEGCVRGNIRSKSIDLRGKIYGDVTVSEIMIMKETAYYKGLVVARNLEIEAGAKFFGNCKMDEESSKEKSAVHTESVEEEPVMDISELVGS